MLSFAINYGFIIIQLLLFSIKRSKFQTSLKIHTALKQACGGRSSVGLH